ncbi:MAG: J domain-containing protein [Betaproteobacteria bacterium]|nr:J domain-containing protein [Betaproteobacteria bacterium]
MSTTEILIALAGLYFGYWIVSKLIMDKPKAQPAPEYQSAPPPDRDLKEENAEPTWYETLNVSPDATAAEIKFSYRTLMSQYHPDKVANLGDELKTVAERKSKEINVAYEEGMRQRGERA